MYVAAPVAEHVAEIVAVSLAVPAAYVAKPVAEPMAETFAVAMATAPAEYVAGAKSMLATGSQDHATYTCSYGEAAKSCRAKSVLLSGTCRQVQ